MAVPATYEACRDFFWKPSNDGQRDDSAPGEKFTTRWGITQYTWANAYGQGIVKSPDINTATQTDCDNILHADYWNVIRGSALPPGVNLMVFNDAVLCGTGHAIRLLQRIIGTQVDGVVGPNTLRLANSFGDKPLIDALWKGDDEYFASLANAPLYLNGWERREDDCRDLAYHMGGLK